MSDDEPPAAQDQLRTAIAALARPHRSGGRVVERAALQALEIDFSAALAWITEHGGTAEAAAPARNRGLHSAREDARAAEAVPLRFILPASAF